MFLWLFSVAALAQDGSNAIATWTPFAKLQVARSGSCAAPIGNRILLIGGADASGAATASVEIISADGVSQLTSPLRTPRSGHTCTALQDGRVLVTGGSFRGSNGEVYDPASEIWLPIASTGLARAGSTATLLQDGRVLVAGGYTEDNALLPFAEIFDPNSNRFTASRGQLNSPRRGHTAALLQDGRVFFAGGRGLNGAILRSSEWFDPLTSVIWSGPDLNTVRTNHAAAVLEDGRLLVFGGETLNANLLASVEALDPQGTRWTTLSTRMTAARRDHSAIVIPGNGGVVIAGGIDTQKIANPVTAEAPQENIPVERTISSEFFDPSNNSFRTLNNLEALGGGLSAVAAGQAIACGGTTASREEFPAPNDGCSRILFPAISFSAPVYHPQETVRLAGSNLAPNAAVAFTVDFLRGTALNSSTTAAPQFRILTPRTTTTAAGSFAEVPMLLPLATDIGSRLRITATIPGTGTMIRHVPLKYLSSLGYQLPASTVEGQGTDLRIAVTPVDGAPLPTGSITSTFGPVTLVELLNPMGIATYSSARLPTGALSVTSIYPGDAYYDSAVGRTSLGVSSRTPVIDIVSSTATPEIGVGMTVYAQVRVDAIAVGVAGGPPITGAVTIFESGVAVGRARVLSSSTQPYPQILTAVDYTPLRLGSDLRFTATYEGDANYRPSSSGTLLALVQRALPSLSLAAVPSIFNLRPAPGLPVRFHCDFPVPFRIGMTFPPLLDLTNRTVALTAVSAFGSISKIGDALVEVTRPGTATVQSEVNVPIDTVRVTADFPGDATMRPASSMPVTMELIPLPVSVAFADLPAKVTTEFFTLTASVTQVASQNCGIAQPSGDVEFFIGRESVGRLPLKDNQASIRLQRLFQEGTQEFFIRYYGDARHIPADSIPVTVKFE
jgi:hypothetical protein